MKKSDVLTFLKSVVNATKNKSAILGKRDFNKCVKLAKDEIELTVVEGVNVLFKYKNISFWKSP